MTTTSAVKKAVQDPRPGLVKSLRESVGQYEDYSTKVGEVLQEVWRDAARYVDVTVAMEKDKNTTENEAINRLSRLIKRTPASIMYWVYLGRFVAEWKLQSGDRRIVQRLYRAKNKLTAGEMHRAVDIVKKEDYESGHKQLNMLIARSAKAAVSIGESKARRLMKKKNLWNERQMRLEMMGVKTLLSRYFGVDVDLVCYDAGAGDDTPLLEV